MRRKPNTVGGGAKTNVNGLSFEGRTYLLEAFKNHPRFVVRGDHIHEIHSGILEPRIVGEYYEKHDL